MVRHANKTLGPESKHDLMFWEKLRVQASHFAVLISIIVIT